jgi:hypothetical protein
MLSPGELWDNDLRGVVTPLSGVAAAVDVRRHGGTALAENTGTATVTAAATSVVVTHALRVAPPAASVQLSLTNQPTADILYAWVDTITATQFTIHVGAAPGASTAIFAWRATTYAG